MVLPKEAPGAAVVFEPKLNDLEASGAAFEAGAPKENEKPEPDAGAAGAALAIGAAGPPNENEAFFSITAGGVAGGAPNANGAFVAPSLGSAVVFVGWPKEKGAGEGEAPNGACRTLASAAGVVAGAGVAEGAPKLNTGLGTSATGVDSAVGVGKELPNSVALAL